MCLKKKEATVSRATTSNLLNSRDRGTVVPNPCQAEVGNHFHHPDVSVLGRHRMTVSSAEVQASWETAKAVYECLMMKLRGQKHHADVIAVMSRTAKVNHILGEKMNDRRKQEK
ncbi:BEN domain-containing protein 5-like [Ixodes scapularis]